MVPEKYRLATVGRFLLDAFERRRPALAQWTPQVEAALRHEAEEELVQMEHQLKDLGVDDSKYWHRVRAVIEDILLPRYAAVAKEEIALAKRDYGIWRGGDLVARGVFAVAGLVLGIFVVEMPYIPVYEKWFPALLLVGGPMFPDAAMWWYRRRFQKKLDAIVRDLAKASDSLDTYRPLSELQESLGMSADLAEAPPLGDSSPDSGNATKVRS